MSDEEQTIRVAIADDHTLVREGIAEIISGLPGLEVIGKAASGPAIIDLVRDVQPDAIMLDIEMPGPWIEQTIKQILMHNSNVKIIALTVHDDPSLVDKVLAAGASAYVLKDISREELFATIRGVTRDDTHAIVSVSLLTMKRLRNPTVPPISQREIEVLAAVSEGLNNAQVARRLFITEGTVKRHLTNIYNKLEVKTRIRAVNQAIALGLIPPQIQVNGTTTGDSPRTLS